MHDLKTAAGARAPSGSAVLWRDGRVGTDDAPVHVLQVYEDEEFFARTVADFLAQGLAAGRPAIAIATPEHRMALANALGMLHLPVEELLSSGRLRLLDARATLDMFLRDGGMAPDQFRRIIGGLIESSAREFGGPVQVHGEMVELLWSAGDRDGAAELESMWNDLAARQRFHLLCTYPLQGFADAGQSAAFETICRHHARVVPTERYSGMDNEKRMREVARLQQRAAALETELGTRELLLQREQRARQEAEAANRAKSEFLAVMSHELRTPLNAIAGYVDLLELGVRGPVTEAQREDLGRIKRSQRHLTTLINEVLSYARVESGAMRYELEALSVRELLASVDPLIRPQLERAGLALVVEWGLDDACIFADAERVRQILLNLLSNAAKFTARGGQVQIWWEQSTGANGTAMAFLHVRDTGEGIPIEKQHAVFEPFVQVYTGLTRPHDGTGLGLAISRDLARGMHGDLTVSSTPGEGSTFTLSLPLR